MTQNIARITNTPVSLPTFCYAYIKSNAPGNFIGMIKLNETGYYRTNFNETNPEKAKELVKELNEKLGVTEIQALCMSNGSLFGWDKPGANIEYMTSQYANANSKSLD